ncbi:MAG: NADP-dependent oxidoreductase [Halieaceae bacterium]|nr:NADP-dependent oxidoreductase [Halieaceae bacterium]
MLNRQVVLKSYPTGVPLPEDFELIETSVAEPGEGQMLVRNLFFSLEAAIRSWLDGIANYFEPIPLGGAIRGPSVAKVISSHLDGFESGDIIFGLHHWEDYSLSDANTALLSKLSPEPDIPLSYYSGGLGGSGHTAYVGLHEIGKIQAGETVLISAAAGATGSMATQIANLRGCKVVGVVGGDDKATLITQTLGASAAINYKSCGDLKTAITDACPEGVDVYFDNVGGNTLDAALQCMKTFGRVIGCGMISDYNHQDNPTPIYNMWKLVERELTMKGFLLYTYMDKVPAASQQLHEWVRSGEIKILENITQGLPNAGWAYSEMMRGATIGKNVVAMDLRPEESL